MPLVINKELSLLLLAPSISVSRESPITKTLSKANLVLNF